MKLAMLRVAFNISVLSTAFGIETYEANLTNADLLFLDTNADSTHTVPSKVDTTIYFNSLIRF